MLTHAGHKKLVEPLDLDVLNYINEFSTKTILHICGYGKYTNNLSWYKDYPVAAYNWAVYSEGITLGEGIITFPLGGIPLLGIIVRAQSKQFFRRKRFIDRRLSKGYQ